MRNFINTILKFLKTIIAELVIVSLYLFIINNYIGKTDKTINADGIGYYDYLPSIFIYKDINRKDISITDDSLLYQRINSLGVYVECENYKVDKYPCGTALLQLPFFATTCLITNRANDNDGYQSPFQKTVFHAAIFYLLLSIFFLKKLLKLYDIKGYAIFFAQLLLVFATNAAYYSHFDASFSHIYSLFAITAFFYFAKMYFKYQNIKHFVIACIFIGLILILRQTNIISILFIPFLAGSFKNLKEGIINIFKKPKTLIIGILIIVAIFSIQCLLWYFQTGKILVYSYPGEGFNFLNPQILNILISFKKGLFVYTPIIFIALCSIFWWVYKRKYFIFFSWFSFFVFLTYFLSSWHSWFYGCSYGLRAYIDFYPIFFIPLAVLISEISIAIKFIVITLSFLTIPLNIIQTYQYKVYILHWIDMDKDKYWKVFMKTDDTYKGLLFKQSFDSNNYIIEKEIKINDITISKNKDTTICITKTNEIPNFGNVKIIQVYIDNEFNENNNAAITLTINELNNVNNNYYWHNPYLIHYCDHNFNKLQTGTFNYVLGTISDNKEKIITIEIKSGKQNNYLRNIRFLFLSPK